MNSNTVPTYKFALTNELIKNCEGTEFEPTDFLPTRAEKKATGWDVRCASTEGFELREGCYYKIPLGIHALPPDGWWLKLTPRSSTFTKRHLNSLYGTIDEMYYHQIFFACKYSFDNCKMYNSNYPERVEFGDRIGQLIPAKRQEMNVAIVTLEELKQKRQDSERTGGFGSTGVV